VRAHRVYGFSPVQQVLMSVNIALRRQLWQLDYFTEGSIPDALIGVPQGWTPDQIKQFQDYWDTEFAGDLAKRRRAKFVPGDTASRIHQTKEPQHKDEFDEWLARIICFAFSVPPQWAVKGMNRATAQNQSEQAEAEGLEPTKEWVKDLIDEIVAEEFASPDLELHWLEEDEGEPEKVLEGRLKLGALTLNEMRDALGLDPFDNAAADRPMVLTATGYVPIEANAGGEGAGANGKGATAQTAPTVQKYSSDQPRVPAGNSKGGQWTEGDGGSGSSSSSADATGDGSGSPIRYAARDAGTLTDETVGASVNSLPPSTDEVHDDAPKSNERYGEAVPVVDFSGGVHGELVDAWMDYFKKQGYPAVKELPIRLVGGMDVYGRLDILAKLPICGICALEMKTGNDPTFTENQRFYIPMLLLGEHVYSTDARIQELGLLPGLPFPPMPVFVIWAKPGETEYRVLKLVPKKQAPK
jgi:hypothetical protein